MDSLGTQVFVLLLHMLALWIACGTPSPFLSSENHRRQGKGRGKGKLEGTGGDGRGREGREGKREWEGPSSLPILFVVFKVSP